jgi:large subunit ribosomal protein L3
MAGHMGLERVTARRLEVLRIDAEKNLLLLVGPVPGNRDGLLLISKTTKRK